MYKTKLQNKLLRHVSPFLKDIIKQIKTYTPGLPNLWLTITQGGIAQLAIAPS